MFQVNLICFPKKHPLVSLFAKVCQYFSVLKGMLPITSHSPPPTCSSCSSSPLSPFSPVLSSLSLIPSLCHLLMVTQAGDGTCWGSLWAAQWLLSHLAGRIAQGIADPFYLAPIFAVCCEILNLWVLYLPSNSVETRRAAQMLLGRTFQTATVQPCKRTPLQNQGQKHPVPARVRT